MAGTRFQSTWPGLARDPLGHRRAVLLGLVGEHGAGDRVADRPDARRACAQLRVHLDPLLLVEGDPGLVEAEPVGVGPAPDRDQDLVRREFQDLALALGREDRAAPLGP
jgi:hypothetical protein